MVKKLFLILLVAGITFSASASGHFDSEADKNTSVETIYGYINWYGNHPVEYHGFVCEDGRIFTLEIPENAGFTLKDITTLNRHRLQLQGTVFIPEGKQFQVHKDGIFTVKKFRDLSKK